MGTTFDNCHIRGAASAPVTEALRTLASGPCFVTTEAFNGWISVYADSDDHDKLARSLSKHLQTAALHFWEYDSSATGYSLYENGENRDEFDSDPDIWVGVPDEHGNDILPKSSEERAKLAGNPAALLPFCVPGTTGADIKTESLPEGYDADDIAWNFMKRLGFEESEQAGARYSDIASGEVFFPTVLVNEDKLTPNQKNQALWDSVRNGSLPAVIQTVFTALCRENVIAAIRRWLSLGADPNFRKDGVPVLICAASIAFSEAVEILLAAGADVNAQVDSDTVRAYPRGTTALASARQAAQWRPQADTERVAALLQAAEASF